MLLRICIIILSLGLMACASSRNYTAQERQEHKALCFEQAQDIYNAPVNKQAPYENTLYVSCMQNQYGYNLEELQKLP